MDALVDLVALAAVATFIFWFVGLYRGRRSWKKTEGRVESCETADLIKAKVSVPGVRLYYSYDIKGEKRDGRFAEFTFRLEEKIPGFCEQFQQGTPLIVRYLADDPDESMIDPNDNREMVSLTGTGKWYRWLLPD